MAMGVCMYEAVSAWHAVPWAAECSVWNQTELVWADTQTELESTRYNPTD